MIARLEQQFGAFWDLVVSVWNQGLFGATIGQVLAAMAILLFFIVLRGLFSEFVLKRIQRLTKRTKVTFDDTLHEALAAPLRFVFIILGIFFFIEYLGPEGTFREIGDNAVRSLIAIAIFWGFYNLVEPLSVLARQLETVLTHELVNWLIRAAKWAIIFVGAATVLQTWGIQIGPIIAGLGIVGVAVALGAQDLFKNLISGMMILLERRFRIGDWVLIEGLVEGTVEQIGFRSTMIRRFDKAPVHVPNAHFADSAVTNFSAMTHRRIYWKIGVEYRTTVDQLRQIRDSIEAYLLESDEFAHPPEVSTFVRIDAFSDSSIDIMIYCFTKTTDWGEWLRIKEEFAYAIKEIVEGAGTGFAFPSQSLYVESLPSDRPEVFVPPPGE